MMYATYSQVIKMCVCVETEYDKAKVNNRWIWAYVGVLCIDPATSYKFEVVFK